MAKTQTADLSDNFEELKEKMAELEDNLRSNFKSRVRETQQKFEDVIEEKPMQSVAAAFGAGIIAGAVGYALMRRK